MAEEKSEARQVSPGAWLKRAGLFLLFSVVLLIPKTLGLRRRKRLWNGLRIAAAMLGAFLLMDAAKGGGSGWQAAAGLLLVLLALVARPAREGKSVDEQARVLGALVVVNGGRYAPGGEKPVPVRLYVAAEAVHVLDLEHRPQRVIPLAAVESLRVEKAEAAAHEGEGWRLVMEWSGEKAVFSYEGFFAEHLARVAETTLRAQMRKELRVLG